MMKIKKKKRLKKSKKEDNNVNENKIIDVEKDNNLGNKVEEQKANNEI